MVKTLLCMSPGVRIFFKKTAVQKSRARVEAEGAVEGLCCHPLRAGDGGHGESWEMETSRKQKEQDSEMC